MQEQRRNFTFIESPLFMRNREAHFGNDENFRKFQNLLLANPRLGDVMPGTGGVRKVRVASPMQGRGQRGGLRVLYLYTEDRAQILLLTLYAKNESENPTRQELKIISQLADQERKDEPQP